MDPFLIPARGDVEIECEATPYEPGSFRCPMYITYYDGDYQALQLSVAGTWISPTKSSHDTTTP